MNTKVWEYKHSSPSSSKMAALVDLCPTNRNKQISVSPKKKKLPSKRRVSRQKQKQKIDGTGAM
eukprot:11746039-Ditylum_brightwellii.AAC.1